jgi:dihydrofolate reductase
MRKIILSVAVSLDGFIEGPNGEYDWCPPPSKKEMDDFLKDIDIIFMGRKSYEMAGEFMIPEKLTYVFSNKLKQVRGKNVMLLSGDVMKEVGIIRKQKGKNIWLWGGANLTTTFLNQNLVDEMWLGLVPVVLGKGKPLFQNIDQRKHYTITHSETISDKNHKAGYVSLKLSKAKS